MASKKEYADLSKGAMKSGTFSAPTPAAPKEADFSKLDPTGGAYGEMENSIAGQQKANLADPAMEDRLAKMAAQRRKYYGQ